MGVGERAVQKVEEGEASPGKKKKIFNWEEFWHLFSVWLFSAVVVFFVLFMLTMAENTGGSKSLLKDVIIRLDTLSLMFSLVLSAGLEQVWNNKRQLKYKITMLLEMGLAIIGLLLYLTYSLMNITDPNNLYLTSRFGAHAFYVALSILVVIGGFIVRAYEEQED